MADTLRELSVDGCVGRYHSLARAAAQGMAGLARAPFSIRVLVENMLRHPHAEGCDHESIARFAAREPGTFVFHPARVLLQDLLGAPLLVDLAAMRDAARRDGIPPERVNPVVPVDLVIDHSLNVAHWASADARARNEAVQFERNAERFRFLRWCQGAFRNLRVIPPDSGIMHQINIEHLARVVWRVEDGDTTLFHPDTMIGADSHTPMVNALGVIGWGVGGLDAHAVMLGAPLVYPTPAVLGVRLTGRLVAGVTATDLVLSVTERLRARGVVGKFVEFFGDGLETLSLADRATISNMTPEYGATCVCFPVDHRTIEYLRLTGRAPAQVRLVEAYMRTQGLWHEAGDTPPDFDEEIEFDLGAVRPCVAGPRRPQDRVDLAEVPERFARELAGYFGRGVAERERRNAVAGSDDTIGDGDVLIAAITSCTNTSNPANVIAAGLLARNACAAGLQTRPWVKTSFAPGSKVVASYLEAAGLQPHLDALGFQVAGFGCTTCGGMSGPIDARVGAVVDANATVGIAVLSGNRNFEGRIHPQCRASFLASPALVVAYAIAGRIGIDLLDEPLGHDAAGRAVRLADIWPADTEIEELVAAHVAATMFARCYDDLDRGSAAWQALDGGGGLTYAWEPGSTYLRRPPYFEGRAPGGALERGLQGMRPIVVLGDSITTDHISPSSAIPADSEAGRYLRERGVSEPEFNTFGTRRSNFEVVARASFANIRLRNRLAGDATGPLTRIMPEGRLATIYAAACEYTRRGDPLIVVAGKEYGCGSSRDTAAKGPWLIGVRAVLAESFERIHRSNLVGIGILPVEFTGGDDADALGIDGSETFDLLDIGADRSRATLRVRRADGEVLELEVRVRLDTAAEIEAFRAGGALPWLYDRLAAGSG